MKERHRKAKVAGKVSDALRDQRKAQSNRETKESFMEEAAFERG